MLGKLAEVQISHMQVSRLTQETGEELINEQTRQVELHRRRELPVETEIPVEIACVEVDGGRIRTRAAQTGRGVHDEQWKESKVGCLWRMSGPTFEEDPHPLPPRSFLDQKHVYKMAREIKNAKLPEGAAALERGPDPAAVSATQAERETKERYWPPQREFRTVVATLGDVDEFGALVASEAQRRGFYEAGRQVFLGDGDHKNWTVHKIHFPHSVAITDFVHVVGYVFQAATAVTSSIAAQWEQYVAWMTACWQGHVDQVLNDLREWAERVGPSSNKDDPNDPAAVIARTITYLGNNAPRMNYPTYRHLGLPITSCLVESLIKQVNLRVKATDKFWNRPEGAEAILRVRAALLSDDDRISRHFETRAGRTACRRSTESKKTDRK